MALKINSDYCLSAGSSPYLKQPLLALLCLGLSACFGDQAQQSPLQYWQGIEFSVETRPNPAKVGINEVLIVATRPRRQPEFNLLVSIRMRKDAPWVQGIQDGHTGIFRRGLAMREPGPQTLWVQIQRVDSSGPSASEKIVFAFPIVVESDK